MKLFQIVISIAVGLAAGRVPVVGYNIGAGGKDRVRRLFTPLLSAEATVGVIAPPIPLPMAFGLDGFLYLFPAADLITFLVALRIIPTIYKELATGTNAQKEGV